VLVRGVEGVGNLHREVERLRERQGPSAEAHGEGLAREVLHHEIVHRGWELGARRQAFKTRRSINADVVERADAGVRERGNRARLAFEARAAFRVGAEFLRENLDRDRTVEAGVAGAVNLAHASGANQRPDLVGPEPRARRQGHRGLRGAL